MISATKPHVPPWVCVARATYAFQRKGYVSLVCSCIVVGDGDKALLLLESWHFPEKFDTQIAKNGDEASVALSPRDVLKAPIVYCVKRIVGSNYVITKYGQCLYLQAYMYFSILTLVNEKAQSNNMHVCDHSFISLTSKTLLVQ